MKRFLTCALCFVSLPAIAVPLYYEQDGACPGLYSSQPLTGCNATTVSKLKVTPDADTTFTGFKVNGQTIVDANGNVASNASEILRNAGNVGSKIPQSYDCKSGFSKNNNGICVDPSGNITYVDFEYGDEENGFEVEAADLGRGEQNPELCRNYSKFKVKIHWCPPKSGTYTWKSWSNGQYVTVGWSPELTPDFFPTLWPSDADCNTTEELDYEWVERNNSNRYCSATYGIWDGEHYRCAVYKKQNGDIIDQLPVPSGKFGGWTLRGFYLRENDLSVVPSGCGNSGGTGNSDCIEYWGDRNYFAKRHVVTQTNTEGTARLGLPKPNSNPETGYIDLNDTNNGANGAWANTRWTVRVCWDGEIPQNDVAQVANRIYHLYAGWARDCETPNGGTCNLAIRRTGLYQNNNKGDAFYTTTCNGGATPENNGAYNPICPEKCALNNLSACSENECLDLSGTNWCAGTPQCVLGSTARRCCVGSLGNCTTQKDCESVGGTWNGTTCSGR